MRRHSLLLVAGFALACSAALAQQPAPPQPDPQATAQQVVPRQPTLQPPAQRPGSDEGFFRPAPDPVINPPAPAARSAPNAGSPQAGVLSPDVANSFAAQVRAREALERELDRSQRENERAQAEAARRPAPMIVSPLDGTAPIISPLGR